MLHLQHMDQPTSILDDKKYSKQFIDTIHFILINLELRIMQYATSTTGFLFNSFLDKRSSCSLAFLFFYFQLLGRNWLNLKGQFDGEGEVFFRGPFFKFHHQKTTVFFSKFLAYLIFLLNMVLFFSCEKNCTYVLTGKTKIVFMFCFISFALGHKLSIIGFFISPKGFKTKK